MSKSSRTENSLRNIKYSAINKVVTMFLSLMGRYIFLMILPIDYLGINGLFNDIFTMMSLADLGLSTAMAFSFYKPLAENDTRKVTALVTLYRKLYNSIACFIAVVGLFILPFLDYVVNTDLDIPHLRLYYLISLFNTVVSYLFAYKQSLIVADQKLYIIQRYAIWMAMGKIVFQALVLYITHSYIAYLMVGVVNAVVYNLFLNYQANKNYPYILGREQIDKESKKQIFSNVAYAFIYKLSAVIMDGTDNILISVIVNTATVGLYMNYLTIINRISQMVGSLFWAVTASTGNLITEQDQSTINKTFDKMMIMGDWLGGFAVISLFCLMEEFIAVWLGEKYIMDVIVFVVILANIYYSITISPVCMFREAAGLYKNVRWIMFVCAIENIVLSIILGRMFGLLGIILASFISRMTTVFWFEPMLLFKKLNLGSFSKYLFKIAYNVLLMILFGILTYEIVNKINAYNIWIWIIKSIICVIIVNALYMIKYCRNDNYKEIIYKVIGVMKKKYV